ncbi:hypothetical protein BGZ59_009933, partial [Podila verticillata]
ASSDMFEQRNNDLFIELEAAQGTMKTLLDDKTSEITIGTLEGTVAELRNEVANLQSHSVYLNTSNKAQEITYNALAHDHRRLKETVKTLKTKGTELDNGALFEAIEDTKTKAAAVYAQNTELCQMLATLQASHSTLENTTALLASRNSEMSELLLRANADVAALRCGTSQLREMVENSNAKGANLQKHNQYLNDIIESAGKKAVTLVEKVQELESHNRALGNTNSHLSEHVRKLEVDAANLKCRYDSLVNELEIAKAVTREKKILESRLQIIKVNSDFLDSKNKDLVAENASVNKNLEITHGWARFLWDRNSILIENAKAAEVNEGLLSGSNAALQKEVDISRSTASLLKGSNAALRKDVDISISTANFLKEQIKALLLDKQRKTSREAPTDYLVVNKSIEPKARNSDDTCGSKRLALKRTQEEKEDEDGYDQGRDMSSTSAPPRKGNRGPVRSTMLTEFRRA